MTRFVIGLLLGTIVGIAGTSVFLISASGSDYLIAASPRFREVEAQLKQAERERDGMIKRLDQFTDLTTKLESRFVAMAGRFESLAGEAAGEPNSEGGTPGTANAASTKGATGTAGTSPTPKPVPTSLP